MQANKNTDGHGHHDAVDMLEQTAGRRLSGSLTAAAAEQERCDQEVQQSQQERIQQRLPARRQNIFGNRPGICDAKDGAHTGKQQVIAIPEKSHIHRIREKRQRSYHRVLQSKSTEPWQKKQDTRKENIGENCTGDTHGNQNAGDHQKADAEDACCKRQQAVFQQYDIIVCKAAGDQRSQRSQQQQHHHPGQH